MSRLKPCGVAAIALALAGCTAHAKPFNICLQPSDRTEAMSRCDSTIQPLVDADPVRFVARQMLNAGDVMLWIGQGEWRDANYTTVIAEAKKYPGKVTYVYVADEIDLCAGKPCIGRDGALVAQATAIAHTAGFKTAAVITQSVIWAPGFKLPAVDAIGIDPYPVTMTLNLDMGGCQMASNPVLNQWLCSVSKLRTLGFTGPMVYVAQAFGLTTDTPTYRTSYLLEQADAYEQSGADGVVSWGCYLGADDLRREPNLVPLCGTQYEGLVTP